MSTQAVGPAPADEAILPSMTPSAISFLETFAVSITAVVIAFWLGRRSRDSAIKKLEAEIQSQLEQIHDWSTRALSAEGKKAKRGKDGRFKA